MTRVGHGRALGAITILNATATGIGCALAIDAVTTATWSAAPTPLNLQGSPDDALVRELMASAGGTLEVHCPFPASRGLKTSSSVAAALVRAKADAFGQPLDNAEVEARAIEASRRAGVTLTGALDDQVAAVRGGCHLTDNETGRIDSSLAFSPWEVAIWVPLASIPKALVRAVDPTPVQSKAREAASLARRGDLPGAMTLNGRAFHALYVRAGLPVDDRPVRVALEAGASGAGLSGTGPAVAALFESRCDLLAVPGGTWQWARSVSLP